MSGQGEYTGNGERTLLSALNTGSCMWQWESRGTQHDKSNLVIDKMRDDSICAMTRYDPGQTFMVTGPCNICSMFEDTDNDNIKHLTTKVLGILY